MSNKTTQFKKGMTTWNKGTGKFPSRMIDCKSCGVSFLSKRERTKFCSKACYASTPLSQETKDKISQNRKGKGAGDRNARALLGKKAWNTGVKQWEDKVHPMLGKTHSDEYKKRKSEMMTGKEKPWMKGENHPAWRKDRTLMKKDWVERHSFEHKKWKRGVHSRDAGKCRINNKDCSEKLEAHHILNFKDHPELRFVVNNGISLCSFHHPRKRSEEERLSPYFTSLINYNT